MTVKIRACVVVVVFTDSVRVMTKVVITERVMIVGTDCVKTWIDVIVVRMVVVPIGAGLAPAA